MILKSFSIGRNALMISSFKVRLSRCCGGIGCPLAPGEEGILGRRISWAREVVTGTGKKLELGLRKKYFGPERGFPESSGMEEPNRGGQGRTPRRSPVRVNPWGVRGCRPEGEMTDQGGSIREHSMAPVMSSLAAVSQFFQTMRHECPKGQSRKFCVF